MKKPILLPTFIAALGGLLLGYDMTLIKSAMPFFTLEFQLTTSMQGYAISSSLIGCIFGALWIGRQSDFYGRRTILMILAFLFLGTSIGTGVINNFRYFVFFRFFTGIAVGGLSVLVPIYISEISPPRLRGRLIAAFPLAIGIGIIMAFISDNFLRDIGGNNWRFMVIAGGFLALLYFLLLFFVPESPRWLMQKGYERETRNIMYNISPEVDRDQLIQDIKDSINIEIMAMHTYLFRQPYLRVVLIGIAIGIFNQFTGINAIMYYASDIFKSAGFSAHSFNVQALIIGLTNLVFTIVAISFIDKFGRKKLLMVGSIGMAVSLSLLAILKFAGLQVNYILVELLIGFIGFFAISQGTVIWVLLSEMFPYNIRTRGASLGLFLFWSFNIITFFLFPIIDMHLGIGTVFALCAIATFGSYFFFRKYLVETKGQSLEELEKHIMKKKP